ncbi:glucokinase [Colwellia psychrerythraea 34H]|uniref:Glucokinase n=1 Tax=Colwellia psychrerythraea (strain 34H / ATCC BAA-681) TaxID=167879 RepID=Q482B0_COLP3|nr:glucokinase [Colwellia psychrerythraea 34H]
MVADIGGTNIRLAIASPSDVITDIATYQCAKFANLIDVIRLYIMEKQLEGKTINACLAIACPVDDDYISMTNLPWQFSQKDLKEQLKLNTLTLINDYTAIALAIPYLSDSQKVKIGAGEAVSNKAISVCGPGTGLGVATLVPLDNKWHCISGEGGHVDFAPVDELEVKVFSYIYAYKKRVSYEQLLSGYGLEQIYQALVKITNEGKSNNFVAGDLSAEIISTNAINGDCILCKQALEFFCKVLGSFAGNLALTANSLGGVYIAGGIVPRFIDFIEKSGFRERFETKGRLSSLTQQTPTYVITETQPGLLGAAAYLNQL